jgi:uncharacterized repeat protein (TIGR04138 family)
MQQTARKTLEQVVDEYGHYPIEAFEFVRQGLSYTVGQIHGDTKNKSDASCHVSGAQLAWGLRDFAVARYGHMAQAVLAHWHINRSIDFGKIVFAMVESKLLQKTDDDDLRDFDGVFEFDAAFAVKTKPAAEPRVVFSL